MGANPGAGETSHIACESHQLQIYVFDAHKRIDHWKRVVGRVTCAAPQVVSDHVIEGQNWLIAWGGADRPNVFIDRLARDLATSPVSICL